MSRWIDADALIESVCHTADLGGWIGDTLRNIKRLAVRYINSAPSINIVRCRECRGLRYCETEDMVVFLDCDHPDGGGIPRSEEWFCADGERSR